MRGGSRAVRKRQNGVFVSNVGVSTKDSLLHKICVNEEWIKVSVINCRSMHRNNTDQHSFSLLGSNSVWNHHIYVFWLLIYSNNLYNVDLNTAD